MLSCKLGSKEKERKKYAWNSRDVETKFCLGIQWLSAIAFSPS